MICGRGIIPQIQGGCICACGARWPGHEEWAESSCGQRYRENKAFWDLVQAESWGPVRDDAA